VAKDDETGEKAESIFGDKLYQQRARMAFPILVRQAEAKVPVTYEGLAEELAMPNPRNLNFVLGSVGRTIQDIAKQSGQKIPPLTALVVQKNSGMPGTGLAPFMDTATFNNLLAQDKREALKTIFREIYFYPDWQKLLAQLGLEPSKPIIGQSPKLFGSGESEAHLALKHFLAQNPKLLGIKGNPKVSLEHVLRSGDRLDLLFVTAKEVVAVEVKAGTAPASEIERGIFQVVKYQALLEATALFSEEKRSIRVILALGGAFPMSLIAIRNTLNVECLENLTPSAFKNS
jgi:hypothetical protein